MMSTSLASMGLWKERQCSTRTHPPSWISTRGEPSLSHAPETRMPAPESQDICSMRYTCMNRAPEQTLGHPIRSEVLRRLPRSMFSSIPAFSRFPNLPNEEPHSSTWRRFGTCPCFIVTRPQLTWREEGLNDKGTSRSTSIQYQQQPSSPTPSLQKAVPSVFRFLFDSFSSDTVPETTLPRYKFT